jgi:Gas vesicle protein K
VTLEADRDDVARGLAQLVLTLIELLRQLMERQAIRRVEAGGLSEEQIERLGTALMALEQRRTSASKTRISTSILGPLATYFESSRREGGQTACRCAGSSSI